LYKKIEEWRDGGMEDGGMEWWRDGVVAGWSGGGMEWWRDGVVAGWSGGGMEWWRDGVPPQAWRTPVELPAVTS